MKKLLSKELIIGASVLLSLLILFFGIDYLKGINVFKSANYYYASYTNVAGLTQSAPVTLNGYKIGLVREINYEYDNPGHVLVEISLDKQLKVPVGTKAPLSPTCSELQASNCAWLPKLNIMKSALSSKARPQAEWSTNSARN